MVVNTKVLKEHPELGKALVGAWYETMAVMQAKDDAAARRADVDGQGIGNRPCRLQEQLATTNMYWQATDAVAAITSPDLLAKNGPGAQLLVREGAAGCRREDRRCGGHRVPGRQDAGQPEAVTMRFDASYMRSRPKASCSRTGIAQALINQRPAEARASLGACRSWPCWLVYVIASKLRLAENGADKLLPSLGSMAAFGLCADRGSPFRALPPLGRYLGEPAAHRTCARPQRVAVAGDRWPSAPYRASVRCCHRCCPPWR